MADRLRAGRRARLHGLAIRTVAFGSVEDVDVNVDGVGVVGDVVELHSLVDHVQRLIQVTVLLVDVRNIGVRHIDDTLR